MTSRKLSLPLIPLCLIVVVSFAFAVPVFSEDRTDERVAAASCQRCGDGYCARSCENERTHLPGRLRPADVRRRTLRQVRRRPLRSAMWRDGAELSGRLRRVRGQRGFAGSHGRAV